MLNVDVSSLLPNDDHYVGFDNIVRVLHMSQAADSHSLVLWGSGVSTHKLVTATGCRSGLAAAQAHEASTAASAVLLPLEQHPRRRSGRARTSTGWSTCVSCQRLIDPVGVALQNFHVIARWCRSRPAPNHIRRPADYTFVNERLADHYGIPNIQATDPAVRQR
jgi:hypothetical protein